MSQAGKLIGTKEGVMGIFDLLLVVTWGSDWFLKWRVVLWD